MQAISWEDRDGARWIELEGELDHGACLELADRFEQAVEGASSGDVVVLMDGVSFVSSMAIGLFLKANARLRKEGRRLRLSGTRPAVSAVLEAMNLRDILEGK